MGLKDKAKGLWKRVSDLDDSDVASSSSKDKERIPYKDISKKLKEIMKQNVDVVGRKIIIPSYYEILFNESDRKMREEVEEVVCDELKEELYHEMRKINPEYNKKSLVIKVETDTELDDGQFRITYRIKAPEAGEQAAAPKPSAPSPPPSPAPDTANDMDYQQTVIEQHAVNAADDAQTVVMQKPTSAVLYKLTVDSGTDVQEQEISKPIISLGRGSKDDIHLPSPDFAISRSHATLAFRDGAYFITPSGINGTLLNGQELELNKEATVSPGDEIKIMDYTLKILE